MSTWTDWRDTFTAPVRAVGGFVDNVVHGQNVLESAGKLVGQEFAAGLGGLGLVTNIGFVHTALDKLSPLTVGITGDLNKAGSYGVDVNAGKKDLSWNGARDQFTTLAVDAAIVGTAVATGGAASTYLGATAAESAGVAYLAGRGYSGLAKKGDVGELLKSAESIGGSFIPDGYKDTFNDAKKYYDDAQGVLAAIKNQPGPPGPPHVSEYASSTSGYGAAAATQAGGGLLLLAALGAAAYFVLRNR